MLKRILLCLVLASICSTSRSVFAQEDLFISFGQGLDVSNTFIDVDDGDNGTAFLYARNGFDFDAIDLYVDSSDPGVLQITGGEMLNSSIGGFVTRYAEPVSATVGAEQSSIRFFGASFAKLGVDTAFSADDEDFDTAANAFLLGTLDYAIVGEGPATLDIRLGPNEILRGDVLVDPNSIVFGSASLTAVPEPSSAALLALGLAGLLTRRRR